MYVFCIILVVLYHSCIGGWGGDMTGHDACDNIYYNIGIKIK